ncbi:MAG TPA: hypothetical protein PLB32_02985 [Acidobacteriota bacterium]|nr:hypothetical protein [Acidobacteriota bacterium]
MTDFFSVESNLEQVLAHASKWAENVDVSPAMEKAVPVIFADMTARFEAEGYGKWKPNQPGYLKQKAREFSAGLIEFDSLYRRTGALFRSLTSRTQNTDIAVDPMSLRLGSNLGYARYLPGLIDLSPESHGQIGLLLRDEMQVRFNTLGIGLEGGAA